MKIKFLFHILLKIDRASTRLHSASVSIVSHRRNGMLFTLHADVSIIYILQLATSGSPACAAFHRFERPADRQKKFN